MRSLSTKDVRRFATTLGALALFTGIARSAAVAQAQAGTATTRTATSPDGIRIAYETHGDGPLAVIFVHGWSCDRSYWKAQLEPTSRRYRVVAVDLAGHGESGFGRKDWTVAAFGGDVAAVVKQLDLRRVVLVGHSMGGDVIAEAARQLPGRVVGLVWVDAYRDLGSPRTPEQVQARVARFRTNFVDSTRAFVRGMFLPTSDHALVDWVANDMSSAPADVALNAMEHAFAYGGEMPRTLEALKLPVIAINPDNGPTDTSSMHRYGVEVVMMPGVGHFPMMEDPPRFNALLESAIARLAR
jgi:pimeloyl-ACP methyl ester carboxylesterase